MAYQNIADELENEIVSMEQELILKRVNFFGAFEYPILSFE